MLMVSFTTTSKGTAGEAHWFSVITSSYEPESASWASVQRTVLSVATTTPSSLSHSHSSAGVSAVHDQSSPSQRLGMLSRLGASGCSRMISCRVSGSISQPSAIPDTTYIPVSASVMGPNCMASPDSVNPLGPIHSYVAPGMGVQYNSASSPSQRLSSDTNVSCSNWVKELK